MHVPISWRLPLACCAMAVVTNLSCALSPRVAMEPTPAIRPTRTSHPTFTPTPQVTDAPLPSATSVPPTETIAPPPADTPVPPTPEPAPTETPAPEPTTPPVEAPAAPQEPPPEAPPPAAAAEPGVGAHGVIGKITLRDGRTTYAAGEQIFVKIEVINPSGASVAFGVLGLTGDGGQFHTTYTEHSVDPGSTFNWEDGMPFTTPGAHTLWLSVCFSSRADCEGGSGDWERFEPGVAVTVQ